MSKKFILLLMLAFVFSPVVFAQDVLLSLQDPKLQGQDVIQLQKFLLSQGYDLGIWGADGVFGSVTDEALRQWQSANGKEPSGQILVSQIPALPEIRFDVSEPLEKVPEAVVNPLDPEIKPGDTLTTVYGSWDIPPLNENSGEKYHSFRLSPTGRYVAAFFYSPYGDPYSGMPLCIYDLLTEEMEMFYGFELMGLSYDKIVECGEYTGFYNFFWTGEGELFFSFASGCSDGTGWGSYNYLGIH